jgi:hypothetical protein
VRMLDLCCGRLGWSKAFLSRGWECVGVDLVTPPSIPAGFTFRCMDILDWRAWDLKGFDFACASTPCEEFSVHGQRHFHPNPKYPSLGIELFNHARRILEDSGIPFIIENVRPAQEFVGDAVNHCGPFFFWGNAVPPILPQGITKSKWKPKEGRPGNWSDSFMGTKSVRKAATATIPPELAACVADYAGRIRRVSV